MGESLLPVAISGETEGASDVGAAKGISSQDLTDVSCDCQPFLDEYGSAKLGGMHIE